MFYTLRSLLFFSRFEVLLFGFPFRKKSFRVFTRNARNTSSPALYEKHDGFRRRKERRQRRTHQLESEGPGSFLVVVVVAAAVLVFKRSLLLLLLLLLLGLFFRKRAWFSLFEKSLSPISPSFLCCSNETQISLSFSLKKQDNAEVHFKVKMGTKFKKVRVRAFRFILLRKTTRRELDARFLPTAAQGTRSRFFSFSLVRSYL